MSLIASTLLKSLKIDAQSRQFSDHQLTIFINIWANILTGPTGENDKVVETGTDVSMRSVERLSFRVVTSSPPEIYSIGR